MADVTSRLDFLNDAAHLLAKSAPETSSHLLTARNAVLLENGLERSDADRQHSCGACGQVFILGQGASLKLEATGEKHPTRRRKQAKQKAKEELSAQGAETVREAALAKIFTCDRCGAFTRIRMAKPVAPRKRAVGMAKPEQATVTAMENPTTSKAAANANSKKRAKARKSGLQALLDENKKQSGPGIGLTLGHFLKKPA